MVRIRGGYGRSCLRVSIEYRFSYCFDYSEVIVIEVVRGWLVCTGGFVLLFFFYFVRLCCVIVVVLFI